MAGDSTTQLGQLKTVRCILLPVFQDVDNSIKAANMINREIKSQIPKVVGQPVEIPWHVSHSPLVSFDVLWKPNFSSILRKRYRLELRA